MSIHLSPAKNSSNTSDKILNQCPNDVTQWKRGFVIKQSSKHNSYPSIPFNGRIRSPISTIGSSKHRDFGFVENKGYFNHDYFTNEPYALDIEPRKPKFVYNSNRIINKNYLQNVASQSQPFTDKIKQNAKFKLSSNATNFQNKICNDYEWNSNSWYASYTGHESNNINPINLSDRYQFNSKESRFPNKSTFKLTKNMEISTQFANLNLSNFNSRFKSDLDTSGYIFRSPNINKIKFSDTSAQTSKLSKINYVANFPKVVDNHVGSSTDISHKITKTESIKNKGNSINQNLYNKKSETFRKREILLTRHKNDLDIFLKNSSKRRGKENLVEKHKRLSRLKKDILHDRRLLKNTENGLVADRQNNSYKEILSLLDGNFVGRTQEYVNIPRSHSFPHIPCEIMNYPLIHKVYISQNLSKSSDQICLFGENSLSFSLNEEPCVNSTILHVDSTIQYDEKCGLFPKATFSLPISKCSEVIGDKILDTNVQPKQSSFISLKPVIIPELEVHISEALKSLAGFQDRAYVKFKDSLAKRKDSRRIVCGLREIIKHLQLNHMKFVIFASNMEMGGFQLDLDEVDSQLDTLIESTPERATEAGKTNGLAKVIKKIIDLCSLHDCPVVLTRLKRKKLGSLCHKSSPVSVAGIINISGIEGIARTMVEIWRNRPIQSDLCDELTKT